MKFEGSLITFLSVCTLLGSAAAQSRRVAQPAEVTPSTAEVEPGEVAEVEVAEVGQPARVSAGAGFRLLPPARRRAGGRAGAVAGKKAAGGRAGFRLLEVSRTSSEPEPEPVPGKRRLMGTPGQPVVGGARGFLGRPLRGVRMAEPEAVEPGTQEPARADQRSEPVRRVLGVTGMGGPSSGGAPMASLRLVEVAEAEPVPGARRRVPVKSGRPATGGPRRILGFGGAPQAGGRGLREVQPGKPVRRNVEGGASKASKAGKVISPVGSGATGLRSDMQQLRGELRDIRRLMKRLEQRLKRTEGAQRKAGRR